MVIAQHYLHAEHITQKAQSTIFI